MVLAAARTVPPRDAPPDREEKQEEGAKGPLASDRHHSASQSIPIAIFSFSIPTCACKLSARVHLERANERERQSGSGGGCY